mmetsp:Transcript_65035/g.209521  ORF Transcript_65035/g.209521 Transcript_65035/m.209521 type:complete len:833 (-) Transcript_65035:126-2624(-)
MAQAGPVMLFVPQGPMEHTVTDFGSEPSGYAMCMMQEPGHFDLQDQNRHVFMAMAPDDCPSHSPTTGSACTSVGEWTPPAKADGSVGACGSTSKALAIRNPKTGEVIARTALLGKSSASTGGLSAIQKTKWQAAAKVVASRLRGARWCADHSTFSALNVDGLRRDPSGAPGRGSQQGAGYRQPRAAAHHGSQATAKLSDPVLPLVTEKAGGKSPDPASQSAKAAAFLNRSIGRSEKIPAAAAATLAALSLEAGTGRHERRSAVPATAKSPSAEELPASVASAVLAASSTPSAPTAAGGVGPEAPAAGTSATPPAARPWRPKRLVAQEAIDAIQEEPQTSAGGSKPASLPETSDAASGEEAGLLSEDAECAAGVAGAVGAGAAAPPADGSPEALGALFQPLRAGRKRRPRPTASAAPEAEAEEPEAEAGAPTEVPEPVAQESEVLPPLPPAEDSPSGGLGVPGGTLQEARAFLLGFRAAIEAAQPPLELRTLGCEAAAEAQVSPSHRPRLQAAERTDRVAASQAVLTPSSRAYRMNSGGLLTRMDELRRAVQSMLNKICPESVVTIAEKIAEIKVDNADELEHIIGLIFKKALSEPHYCETYADLVFALKSSFPEFPSADGGKPLSFKALLLNICQAEFESLPTSLTPSEEELARYDAEELEFRRKKTKDRVLANMKLIGHLFLRQLLSAKVIGSVIQELTLCDDAERLPEEHVIECAVELLMSIGYTLESLPVGKKALTQVCGRLLDLKQRKGRDGRGVYSKRIQFAIQDVLDTRNAGWSRKVFSGVAKTKEEIRREQERELVAQARGKEVESGQIVISGQRPLYISAAKKD